MTLPALTSFQEQLNTVVDVVDGSSGPFELIMTHVTEHATTEHNQAFSVFFRGPADHFMQQGIHKLKHSQFGEMDIFLVPVGKTAESFEYEAAFNYILR